MFPVDIPPTMNIDDAAMKMVELARKTSTQVKSKFNSKKIVAFADGRVLLDDDLIRTAD